MSLESAVPILEVPVLGGSGRSAAFPCKAGETLDFAVTVARVAVPDTTVTFQVVWSEDGRTFAPSADLDLFDPVTAAKDDAGVAVSTEKSFTAKGNFFRLAWVADGPDVLYGVVVAQSIPEAVTSAENGTPLAAGAEEAPVATTGPTFPPATSEPPAGS